MAQVSFDPEKVSGWAVSVLTDRLGGGEPMMVLYGTVTEDRHEAIDAVCAWLGYLPGDGVGEAYPLTRATVAAMHRQQGEVWIF